MSKWIGICLALSVSYTRLLAIFEIPATTQARGSCLLILPTWDKEREHLSKWIGEWINKGKTKEWKINEWKMKKKMKKWKMKTWKMNKSMKIWIRENWINQWKN